MNQEMECFLNLANWPARATVAQAAGILGFSDHEIPILVARGLLKPLGHPAPNAPKFFLTEDLKRLAVDDKWCGKASDAVSAYWRIKNERKANGAPAIGKPSQSADAREFADTKN